MDRWQQDQERMAQQVAARVQEALGDEMWFRRWLFQQPQDGEFVSNPVEDFLYDVTGFCWEVSHMVVRLRLTRANRMVQMETPEWVARLLDGIGTCHLGIELLTVADCLAVVLAWREEASHGESVGQ